MSRIEVGWLSHQRNRAARTGRPLGGELLGEEILLTTDSAEVPADSGLVVYREAELRQMAGRTPAEVKTVHALKVAFDGTVVEEEAGPVAGGRGKRPRAGAQEQLGGNSRSRRPSRAREPVETIQDAPVAKSSGGQNS